MANVLIAGCGYVGTALGLRLAEDGHRVWGLRRSEVAQAEPIELMYADVAVPASIPSLPEHIDYLFYMVSADATADAAYQAAYVTGLRNLLDRLEAQRQRPRRVYFVSSTGVYAQTGGEWVDEDAPADAAHFTGARLREGEETVWNGPFPATVVRLAGIYGPGRTRLIESVRDGTAVIPHGPPRFLNLIHRDDCAGALRHLMGLDEPADLYLAVDHEPTDRATILRWIADQLKLPPPPLGQPSFLREGNKRCRNARLVASGYQFAYPSFREGYRSLL